MTAEGFSPPDASIAPRYTGVRTFARLRTSSFRTRRRRRRVGVPFDTATSFRSGARFGPEAIRSASATLRPYHPLLEVDVFGTLAVADGGDIGITPGNAQRTTEQIDAALQPVLRAGVVPVVLGGDHSIVLGELRAQAAVHGPVGAGAARRPRRHLGSVLRRALLPRHSVPARARGGADRPVAIAAGGDARALCTARRT